jgi:hypothetical protein
VALEVNHTARKFDQRKNFRLDGERCSATVSLTERTRRSEKRRSLMRAMKNRSLEELRLGGTSGLRILAEENICVSNKKIGWED